MRALFRGIQEWFKRISGFSTPLFGLTWAPEESRPPSPDISNGPLVLTLDECAVILRVNPQSVVDLLEAGNLVGFSIGNEWRVTIHQLVDFLHSQTNAKQLEVLSNQLKNPRVWARELVNQPDFKRQIESGNYAENTLGRFLQDALASIDTDTGTQSR
jgi:hypothetical protein